MIGYRNKAIVKPVEGNPGSSAQPAEAVTAQGKKNGKT
jgi:hypothetical protein